MSKGDSQYDYETAGFDNFLSRSIENNPQVSLNSPAPVNNAIAFDRSQSSGALGDVISIGNIKLDGVTGRISVFDASGNEVVRIGDLGD